MFVAVSLLFARVACRNPKGSLMTRKRPVLDIHRNLGNPPNKMPTREQTTRPSVCYLPTPDRSFSDRKQYRSILLPNGLHALLIADSTDLMVSRSKNYENFEQTTSSTSSDDEDSKGSEDNERLVNKVNVYCDSDDDSDSSVNDSFITSEHEGEKLAAAALCVGVGSFSDPRHVQGLAHFLEHMIFMGSKKYPRENEYDSFISKCGGFDNAVTDLEETTFYFEIDEAHLDGALDRFASLFTEPLMLRDSVCRERDAVESEFQTNKNRFTPAREQLIASLGNDDHPISLFSWGNLKTLKNNISDDELYKELHKFQRQHYSAHRMHFAVQARMSLDELESLTVKHFSSIPSNQLPANNLSALFNEKNAFRDEFYRKLLIVKPVSDVCQLDITWCLPPSIKDYHVKPIDYISYIMGYEGKNSLTSYLRKHSLALDVQTGANFGFEKNSLYTLFGVSITMTDRGLENVEQILKAVYSFVRLLKREGPVEWIYKELQELEATSFRYRKEKEASDNVEELVVNMRYYPSEHIITGSELYFKYDPNEIWTVINNLNKPQFNLMISSTKPYRNVTYNRTEAWFGTEYVELDVPKEWQLLWELAEPMPEIQIQEKNQYISTNFTILADVTENLEVPPHPEKIFENDLCELWFRQDNKFRLPSALMYFYIISPLPFNNPSSSALAGLFASIIKYQIAEELYPAEVAGLNYELYSAEKGFVLKIDGYNEKLPIIADEISASMGRFAEIFKDSIFDVIKDKLEKMYYNEVMKPNKLNRDVRLKLVQLNHWSTWEKFEHLKHFTINDVRQFGKDFFKNFKIQALIQGNIEKETAKQVIDKVLSNLNGSPIGDIKTVESKAREIPIGDNYLRVSNFRENDINTVTTTFYQAGPVTPFLHACLELLVSLLEEPLFDMLRTKEQLGYDVSTTLRDNAGILGLSFTIHSQENKFNYQYIDERIEIFNQNFLELLHKMTDIDFELVKTSLKHRKQVVDTDLKNEASRHWGEITTEEYIFNRNSLEVQEIIKLSKTDVLRLFQTLVMDSTTRRKLCVQVVGNNDKITNNTALTYSNIDTKRAAGFQLNYIHHEEPLKDDCRYIGDIESFTKQLKVYNMVKMDFSTGN
ncbi:nardilysin-like isoform X2 [Anopheles arabiensis]|uniref:Nardilysin n=6 Tax=gambiae species complex TaxID=44542 RepID=A0A453YJG8_ANOAR|nr:nardilysin-like isoform X2 [Anopheles arabiensis]XP_040164053.1 nardilysin-like isoform X2 [Anopheles arabiensis]XP_040164054.1 nardilysin-like isoform X2 [Anopheles arabiensis]